MSIKARFIDFLKSKYVSWNNPESTALLNTLISDQLLSETIIQLPKSTLNLIKSDIQGYQKLRDWGSNHLQEHYLKLGLAVPKNTGVCTSFDYHVTETGEIKLIEVNTNAAFLAIGTELYQFHQMDWNFKNLDIISMFQTESQRSGQSTLKSVTIIDEKPSEQRLFIEFLLFQQIFKTHGIDCQIKDVSEIHHKNESDLVYNRHTDFYLEQSISNDLKKLFNQGLVLSPNPYEYFLLADKQRMLDWSQQTDITLPSSLLKIYDLGLADREHVWSERKKLFFKPKNSYGGKQAYKGASISRRTFDEFYGGNMIAQEYAQPSEVDATVGGAVEKMKYDIRCYAYNGELQIVMARLYQGQTTNLRTTGGGFTVVQFV